MNNLNSVLLEGQLSDDPILVYDTKGSQETSFKLTSRRYYKRDDETVEEQSRFTILTYGRLAEVCNEYLVKGRGVRVVGRLKCLDNDSTNSETFIIAEHVEFKPVLKENETR